MTGQIRAGLAVALVAVALAGCSGLKKRHRPDRSQYLSGQLPYPDRSISAAIVDQPSRLPRRLHLAADVAASRRQPALHRRVQLHGSGQVRTKIAIYFAGMISQFIDATPEQCGTAAYAPFNELAAAMPAS